MPVYDSILITGGAGMLARALIRSLQQRNRRATVLNRSELDISDSAAVRRAFDRHQPTLVLNCAAHTKVDLCEDEETVAASINGMGVANLAGATRDLGAKLVHFSTDFVFDGFARRPYVPDDPTNPLSAYGRTKLAGELAIADAKPPGWLIIRTSWLYGPGGACFPQTMIKAAQAGKALTVIDDQIGSPTFTHDLADATFELIDRDASGIWHLSNSGSVSWHGFTAAILEEFALNAQLSKTTSAEWKKLRPNSATRPAYSVMDVAPYERLTGKPMRNWREALHAYRLALSA